MCSLFYIYLKSLQYVFVILWVLACSTQPCAASSICSEDSYLNKEDLQMTELCNKAPPAPCAKTSNLFNDKALTAFLQAIQILDHDFLPAAVQDDILLFAVDGKKIFQDNARERWAQYLILTSLFATLGYRIISCWLGARER